MGRKKKLKKGIKSLEKQNGIHAGKIEEEKSKPHPNEELIAYWEKEREKKREDVEKKKRQIDRKTRSPKSQLLYEHIS